MREASGARPAHLSGARRARIARAAVITAAALSVACAAARVVPRAPPVAKPAPPPPPPSGPSEEEVARAVAERMAAHLTWGAWRAMAYGASYLAPDEDVADESGGVDVFFHFNGGQMAEKEWRRSGAHAVVVSAAYGSYGTTAYREAFADPGRFDLMLDDLTRRLAEAEGHPVHVRRLGLVGWSAGYAAIDMILQEPRYYPRVDTVVLLDGLHTDYVDGHEVDVDALDAFVRFGKDAVAGERTMVVVHSSIIPPNYASTTETAAALCDALGVTRTEEARRDARGLAEWYHVDANGFHLRGYRGDGPKDHIDQLYLLGDLLRTFVVPRWTRFAVLDESRTARAHRGT